MFIECVCSTEHTHAVSFYYNAIIARVSLGWSEKNLRGQLQHVITSLVKLDALAITELIISVYRYF